MFLDITGTKSPGAHNDSGLMYASVADIDSALSSIPFETDEAEFAYPLMEVAVGEESLSIGSLPGPLGGCSLFNNDKIKGVTASYDS